MSLQFVFSIHMKPFDLNFIDHVAIRSVDFQKSIDWYQRVLGLSRADFPEWKNYPVFMNSGGFGVAIFPANTNDPEIVKHSKNSRIDHFAFNVSNEDFELAKKHFERMGIEYKEQDHYYFHSVYLKDPDGHTVELTTSMNNIPDHARP